MFDALSVQRAFVFFAEDVPLCAANVFGLINSIVAAMWCLAVILALKGFL